MKTKIAIGNDHAGYEMKLVVLKWLEEQGYEIENFGTDSQESVDYPDYVHPVASAVENGEFRFGILVCGSGQGVSFTANKHQGIRAALCWNPETAKLAREHNNANILCLPGRFISDEEGIAILKNFMETKFEGGRHQKRICKVSICAACAL
jgi:ribose 5-phosphate isomerase B